jgi:formylmethanofuran dehydrogenase subunit D
VNLSELHVSDKNGYDFRLVVSRVLYDQSTLTGMSSSLAHLPGKSAIHVHPLDLERVASSDGRDVRVSTSRATVVFPVVSDPTVQRGTAWVPYNLPGPDVGDLIDSTRPVIDVRIETL